VQFEWAPTRRTLSLELMNETELKESWKTKKRSVLGERKLFKNHAPQTYRNVGLAVIRTI